MLKFEILFSIKNLYKRIVQKLKSFELKMFRTNKVLINFFEFVRIFNYLNLKIFVRKFFSLNNLSQVLEQNNLLSQLNHYRKITSSSNNKQVGVEIRDINESYFSKICSIDTVEGKNAGLIWALAKEARFNISGVIETPFFLSFYNFFILKTYIVLLFLF